MPVCSGVLIKGPSYLFKHVITQETAYNLLPFAQRRELHRTVAGWIERRESADLAPYYPLLAYHWGRAEEAAKTIDYLELAGEQALRQSAYQEAVGFFTDALRLDAADEVGKDPFRRARWARQLGDAHMGLGQLPECREHVERALALLGRPVPTTRPGLQMTGAERLRSVYVVKAHRRDIQSLRGNVPVRVLHQLYEHPQAPVIRSLITWYDQPNSPLSLESYINVAEPDQRTDFQDLANRPQLRFLFYDASLQHRLSKVVPNHDRETINQIVATADQLRSRIPEASYDFDAAKVAVMERTSL